MRRLGIFSFYEEKGNVEEYVEYLLGELSACLTDLVIVCNGCLKETERHKLLCCTEDIVIRNNIGYDVGAWKEILTSYLGNERVLSYDELVLCNDTFFGPLVPFPKIFSDMEKKGLDFWGLSMQPETVDFWNGTNKVIPAFIQSFFIVISKKMLHSDAFWDYWKQITPEKWNITELVCNYEQRFTPYFASLGYSWEVYTDMSFCTSRNPEENAFTAYLQMPYELIRFGAAPFLKKKCINGKDISHKRLSNGSVKKAITYIEKERQYPVEYIYRYLSRCDKECIKSAYYHEYILSSSEVLLAEGNKSRNLLEEAVLLIVLKWKKMLPAVIPFIKNIQKTIRIKIVCSLEIKNMLQELLPDAGEILYLLQEEVTEQLRGFISDKDQYIGYVEDIYDEMAQEPVSIWYSRNKWNFRNIMNSVQYIENVLTTLNSDRKLGVLESPQAIFGKFLYEEDEKILAGWRKKNLPENGYCARVMEESNASLQISNGNEILDTIYSILDVGNGGIETLFNQEIFAFCRKYSKIYIYGAGGAGRRLAAKLKKEKIEFEGFLVTDGYCKQEYIEEKKVSYLSEMLEILNRDAGIIIAVEKRFQSQIVKTLEERKRMSYIIFET